MIRRRREVGVRRHTDRLLLVNREVLEFIRGSVDVRSDEGDGGVQVVDRVDGDLARVQSSDGDDSRSERRGRRGGEDGGGKRALGDRAGDLLNADRG